jgi:hypothetical protein
MFYRKSRASLCKGGSASIALLTAIAFATFSCAGPMVYRGKPITKVKPSAASVVVALTGTKARPPLLDRALLAELRAIGLSPRVVAADSVPAGGLPAPGYSLSYSVESWSVRTDDLPNSIIVIYSLSILIIPLAFAGLVRKKSRHLLAFEVSLRSLAGVPVVIEATEEGGVARYDLSEVPPIHRVRYTIEMESAVNWAYDEMGNDSGRVGLDEEIADEMAIRMINASMDGVQQAIGQTGS